MLRVVKSFDSFKLSHDQGFTVLNLDDDCRVLWMPWDDEKWPRPVFPQDATYHPIVLYGGKSVMQPRKTVCWDHSYRYSGQWHPVEKGETPQEIKNMYKVVNDLFGVNVNMCLANAYENGYENIAAHSDDEKQMGNLHDVFCFVTGATRTAVFRHKQDKTKVLEVQLPEGLYVMQGQPFQQRYTHEFPKIKGFDKMVGACPSDLVDNLAKARWISDHPVEVKSHLRGLKRRKGGLPVDELYDSWNIQRYSYTLRCFIK
jgi:alkylated DNA repair dioxygenase AlkB